MLLRVVFCLVCARFDASHPGVVFAKSAPDSNVEAFQLFTGNGNLPQEPPPPIVSAGLDKERQWYLYKNIRKYVLEPWQDVMCPLPKEQGPNSADEEMPQRPLVGMDTNLPVIVSTKALQSTGYTDCVDIEAGRGRGSGRARGKGRGRGKVEIVGVEDYHAVQSTGETDCVDVVAGRGRGRGRGRRRDRGPGKTQNVSVEDFHSVQVAGDIDCVDIEAGRGRGRGKGGGRGRPQ